MKSIRLLIVACVLLALLASCGGGSPVSAAKQWLEAYAKADGATALKLTCRQYREDVQTYSFMTAALGLLTGIDTQSGKADLSGLKFKTISQSGDKATVRAEGSMIVSLLGAAMEQPVTINLTMVKEDGGWKVCGAY